MAKTKETDLLKNPLVLEEIERYKWIASEKQGCDIGWDKASQEWLDRYAAAWRKVHAVRKSTVRKPVVKIKKG